MKNNGAANLDLWFISATLSRMSAMSTTAVGEMWRFFKWVLKSAFATLFSGVITWTSIFMLILTAFLFNGNTVKMIVKMCISEMQLMNVCWWSMAKYKSYTLFCRTFLSAKRELLLYTVAAFLLQNVKKMYNN